LLRNTILPPNLEIAEMHLSSCLVLLGIFCVEPALSQSISPPPADGDSRLTITTAPAVAGDKIAILTTATAGSCKTSSTLVPLAANTSNLVLAGSQTTVLLASSLTQSQIICVSITPAAGGGAKASDEYTVGPPVSPPGFDWGMVRAYFTVGALTSQERDQFSHQDLFLSFRLDKQYTRFHKMSDPDNYGHRPSLNSFFEVRLTALPVAVQNCSPSTPSSACQSAPNSGNPSGGTTTQAFLNSQKSARLAFGVYAPFILHEWHQAGSSGHVPVSTPYALFIGPLWKTGFDTTLNGLNQTQQGNGTPSQVQPVGTSGEFYKFLEAGFRLGHYQLSSDPETTPSTLSYLDVTLGHFSNLSSLLCPRAQYQGNNSCNSAAGTLPWTRDMRLHVEGLLEVPATHGFSIGFSTNVVFDPFNLQNSAQNVHIRPADDLRFLFAYKFDISKIAGKLAPSFSN
jgi:hypothetical protein